MGVVDDVDVDADWLSYDQVAERLGTTAARVRQMVRDGYLASAVRDGSLRVPGAFVRPAAGSDERVALDAAGVVKGLRGTITLLRDGGYSDAEIIGWLHVADDTLPGTPIQALRENRGVEVKRRAQAAAL
jgi:hypothetical protein